MDKKEELLIQLPVILDHLKEARKEDKEFQNKVLAKLESLDTWKASHEKEDAVVHETVSRHKGILGVISTIIITAIVGGVLSLIIVL